VGDSEPCGPLEERVQKKRLSIVANSTRRAAWHTGLGFQKKSRFPISISKFIVGGGSAPMIDIFVYRIFSIQYIETLPSGDKLYLSQQEEAFAQKLWEIKYEKALNAAQHQKSIIDDENDDHTLVEDKRLLSGLFIIVSKS
jgi:hypothetical protein